ncbi:MAG TPA: hypothetical protein DFS52_11805, partial [Myxococcales bacterium]|nr:hypothetical protein [Myxococcales bacterium]
CEALVPRLVINEVDYDNVGADSAEFVELFNRTGAPVDLASLSLVFVNGGSSPPVVYRQIELGAAGILPDGGYLVVAPSTVAAAAGAVVLTVSGSDFIQNGAADGIALVDAASGTLLDALSYEGELTAVMLPGIADPVSLVEGTRTEVADHGSFAGSLCRRASNGRDTDDASRDWSFCELSPGAPNL